MDHGHGSRVPHIVCEAVPGRVHTFCIIQFCSTQPPASFHVSVTSCAWQWRVGSKPLLFQTPASFHVSVTSCAWQWRVGAQTFCARNPRTRASATYLVRDGNAGSGLHASQRNEPTQGICPQGNLIGPCRHATANALSAGPVPFNSWSFRRRPRRLLRILAPHLHGILCLLTPGLSCVVRAGCCASWYLTSTGSFVWGRHSVYTNTRT